MRNANLHDLPLSLFAAERERSQRQEALARCSDPADIAAYLLAERQSLLARIRSGWLTEKAEIGGAGTGIAIAREFSDLMDAIIARMFTLSCERVGANPASLPIVIVATGGYGRRELAPFSDIDITFIPQRDGDPLVDRVIRAMFTLLMDICIARCGLEVGYAYRLLEDCGALDHQTTCGLLDARRIIGSDRLFIQFEDAFWLRFNPVDFIFAKLDERERMLAKRGQTPRVVEPHLKEGPGGLRDIQTAVWLVQARNQLAAARVRGERSFEALVREDSLTIADSERLANAKEHLFRVRHALHTAAGAERDELVITRQEEVAGLLGYALPAAEEAHQESESIVPPVERFMADLYPSLALVRRVSGQVMRRVENSRLILGIGLDCKRRQVVPANDALESDDPAWLLWACELAQQYGLEFSEKLERAALALVEMQPILADTQQAAQVFTRLLSRPGKVYPMLQRMADLGILGWYLPEFGALMDLIPYDPSHDHTVGQHSLLVLKNLEALLAETGEELGEMRRILEELPHPEQLFLAALLHDSGKAIPGRPHAEVSEDIVVRVCARLGWSPEATANVRFLVRQHLLMADTSRLRDLQRDETIRDFTREVTDLERLHMLYLLTYADTRAVGEGVWTPVKGRFLRDLWRRAGAVLSDEETADHDEAAIARARHRLLKDLSLEQLPEAEVTEHIQAMPSHYLLNQSLKQMALHIGFVQRVRAGQPVVDFHDERDASYTEITVCAFDDPEPGLLAKIAGVLWAADLNAHSVQVITRVTAADRIALDTLWVDYRGRPLAAGKRREVAANLTAVLTGKRTVQEIIRERRTRLGGEKREAEQLERAAIEVSSVRNDLSEDLTVIDMIVPDRRGVLFLVCTAMALLGWDIHSARADSWRNAARASFYVSGLRALGESEARMLLERALRTVRDTSRLSAP